MRWVFWGGTAKEHDDIARPLLMRPEIPEDLARKLYRHVGKELQEYISAFFGVNDREAQAVADEIILEFVTPQTVSVFMPTEKMINEATQKASLKMLGMDDMMETLNKGDIASFIAQFSVYTGLSSKKIHDSLKLSCPKGMAIACRAFRIQKTDFVKIFLQTHRMRSGRRQVDHGSMLDILQYFDRIRPESALRIIRSERS
ncbi:MAG: hypothetical protein CO093_00530 [Alphaproteobacteria bacterium CG_4_9_14_3_um_filter_47_13]|nr:MAG: hypothetical protein CO093_00530 [Alphaproteobacteria bacterium CG_4_9_14_3_um_filter_47_13]